MRRDPPQCDLDRLTLLLARLGPDLDVHARSVEPPTLGVASPIVSRADRVEKWLEIPILLAALAVIGRVDDADRLYGIVFVVVLFSVVVQGTLVPRVAERLGVPMTETERAETSRQS